MTTPTRQTVAIIGAGPAGLFAAQALAEAGHTVVILNRDIKPGGLAEYGIYYDKHKMKDGLRKQFRRVLANENIHYFGNVRVGNTAADLSLNDLQMLGFDAVLVAAGAQGTKWLGLPGEELRGVYHAKDVVYHYNQLPPYSEYEFRFGQRVCIIGVGNVMADIAHYCIRTLKVAQVTTVARRGPEERKYTDKEIEYVIGNWDLDATRAELERIRERLALVGQTPEPIYDALVAPLPKALAPISDSKMVMQWYSSPAAIVGDEAGNVRALVVDDTEPYEKDGQIKVRNTGAQREIPCDSVVFAIGDRVDSDLGLPLNKWGEFDISRTPRYPVDAMSYEVAGLDNVFVAGWSREASTGLVGAARKDGTNAANAVARYLVDRTLTGTGGAVNKCRAALATCGHPIIEKPDWQRLEEIEVQRATELGVDAFKFGSNDEMLAAIGRVAAA